MKYLILTLVLLLIGCDDKASYYNCSNSNKLLMKEYTENCVDKGTICLPGTYTDSYILIVRSCTQEAKKIFCDEPKILKD